MVLAVWGPIEQSPGYAALATALERHVSAAVAAAARSPFSLSGIGELRDLMEGAGLRNVEVHSRTRMLRFPPPAQFIQQYVHSSPISAALGDTDSSVLEPVVRDVAEALASYLDGRVLSFPIQNHLAAAVRPAPAADS